jgi:EF hand
MKNKLTVLQIKCILALCFLGAAPFSHAEEKMKLDTDGDGKLSYSEYRASKEAAHERQFKKMDNNGDGFIDAAEKQAQKDKMLAMREKRKQKAE